MTFTVYPEDGVLDAWAAELDDPRRHVESGALVLIPVPDAERGVEVDVRIGGVLWDDTAEPAVPAGRYAVTTHRDGGTVVLVLRDLGGE